MSAYEQARTESSAHCSLVDDCARYFNPEYQDLRSQPTGGEVVQPNTSFGILMQQKCVAGLYSNTVSMGRGNLESVNPKLQKNEAVRRFYAAVGTMVNDVVMEGFPVHYQEMLPDYVLAGRGVVWVGFNEDTFSHYFSLYDPRRCFFFENSKGELDTCYRGFRLSARQAVELFGAEVPDKISKDAKDEGRCNREYEFVHCLRPRKSRNAKRRDSANMPFESLYVEVSEKKLVKESGTRRFRYVAPRCFVKRGEKTGRSPAMLALPSMRTLVRGVDDYLDAVEMATKPVLFLPDEEAVESSTLEPGRLNYADLSKGSPFVYGGHTNPQSVAAMNEELKGEIRDLHFVDLFQVLEEFKAGAKTAYEVSQIVAEKIHMIAPLINRLKRDLFAPLYEIIAEDLMEFGMVDVPVPPVLAGDVFRVKYTSRIDAKMNGVDTENLLYAIMEIVQAETQLQGGIYAVGKMKLGEIVQRILESRNVDPGLYEDVRKADRNYADAQAEIARREQAAMMADKIKPVDLQGDDPSGVIGEAMQRAAV